MPLLFQFTLPCGQQLNCYKNAKVSIYATVQVATSQYSSMMDVHAYFNLRYPMGSNCSSAQGFSLQVFQFTLPCRQQQKDERLLQIAIIVSIYDTIQVATISSTVKKPSCQFQFTLPYRQQQLCHRSRSGRFFGFNLRYHTDSNN